MFKIHVLVTFGGWQIIYTIVLMSLNTICCIIFSNNVWGPCKTFPLVKEEFEEKLDH